MKRIYSKILSFIIIATLLSIFIPDHGTSNKAFAAEEALTPDLVSEQAPSKRSQLAESYNIPEEEIQFQLDQGFTSDDIEKSLQEVKDSERTWKEILQSKPAPINLSIDYQSTITNNLGDTEDTETASTPSEPSALRNDMQMLLTTGDPTDVNMRPDEAPYSVMLDREVVSTLSGGLSVSAADFSLPGRNGLGFTLTRTYNSASSQYYDLALDIYGVVSKQPTDEEKQFPIGKGWSWNLSSITIKNDKKYLNLAGSGSFEWDGTKLKGYPWQDITLANDTSVTVNGEASAFVLNSISGIKQYFNSGGLLIQISDPYNNKILFHYSTHSTYGKVLTSIHDAIGNSITISYSQEKVILTKGSETITYYKSKPSDKEYLTQVVDQVGRSTWYDYSLEPASFYFSGAPSSSSNPYALLTGITYPTGAKTVYTYGVVTRYIGTGSTNQVYRIKTREDQVHKTSGPPDIYNHKDIAYTGDMGSSYDQDISFSTTINDGQVTTVYTNTKDYDQDVPPTYYNDKIESNENNGSIKRTTTYEFDTPRRWYWPIRSLTVTSENNNPSTNEISTSRSFDDYGNVTLEVDPMGTRTEYVYDGTTHLLKSTSQQINATQKRFTEYERNTQGSVTQLTTKENDVNGLVLNRTKYGNFDTYGNAQSVTFCKTAACNTTEDIVKTIEFSGTYQYAFPTKTSVVAKDIDDNPSTVTKQYGYNSKDGSISSLTVGQTLETTYQYDALGRVTKATHNADQTSVSIQYDDFNNTITTKDETGVTSYTKWNPLGWKTESGLVINQDSKAKSKIGYDNYGRVAWSQDAKGNKTSVQYDAWNRQKLVTYPGSVTSSVQYDDMNMKKTSTDPENFSIRETMDKLGRVIKQEEIKSNNVVLTLGTNTYNYVGNVTQSVDANTNTTNYQYDVLGRLTSVTNAKQETTSYEYDMLNQVIKTTFPDSKIKVKKYDTLGRVIQTKDANGKAEKMYYDVYGNLTKLIDRNGTQFDYQYSNRHFLLSKIAPDETITFEYDSAGRRTKMVDATGAAGTRYEYDRFTGQLAQQTYPDEKFIHYDYDENGNRSAMTDPFGANVYYSYDNRNRLTTVGQAPGEADATYGYYNNNLLKTITQKNGVTSNYTYDGIQLDTVTQKKGSTVLNSFDYNYDNNKNITQIVQPSGTAGYTYDKLNRIQTSNQGNQEYSYDNRGNRSELTSVNPADSPDASYGYDKRDRLTSVTVNGNTVSYKYNGDGLLWERTEGGQTTRYYNDGADVIAEATVVNGDPKLKARYLRGAGLIARQGTDNEKQYYLQNGHGDVIELRDSSGNTRLNQYTYDIWGNAQITNETVSQPFRYSGEMWDTTTKLQYLRARWYDPSMGRFMTEDTYEGQVNNPLTLNLYTYVENNPLRYNDPTGHIKNSTYNEIELMITESMSLRDNSADFWTNRSQLGTIFRTVFDDATNNQFKYLYGLLTQTSSYENGAGNAEWAKSQLLNALDTHTDYSWEVSVSVEEISKSAAAIPSRKVTIVPQLSSQHYIPKSIVAQYDEINLGRGTPRLDGSGNQKIFNANELKGVSGPMNVWAGSLEFDVPGTDHRILKRPDGKLGYVLEHDYGRPRLFPGPWFPDGGKFVK